MVAVDNFRICRSQHRPNQLRYELCARLSCDNNDTGFKIYTGGQFSNTLGMELGYVNLGKFDRSGGSVRAQGLNLSPNGSLPIADVFSLMGKLGTTYGFTRTSASATGVSSGNENGFGLSYGLGASYDVSSTPRVVVEWDKYRLKTVNGRDDVKLYSAGLRVKI